MEEMQGQEIEQGSSLEEPKLLEVTDLKVSFFTPAGEVQAVGGISYDLNYGEVCSKCHPFYTGKQKLVDTGGRVDRFNKRFNLK